jgi:hypothetical protein
MGQLILLCFCKYEWAMFFYHHMADMVNQLIFKVSLDVTMCHFLLPLGRQGKSADFIMFLVYFIIFYHHVADMVNQLISELLL